MNSQNAFGTELSELLNEDGEEFVEAAYRALLKRRPDSIGGPACLKDMKNGSSKLQILHEISVSDECRIAGGMVDGLTEAHAEERLIEKTRNGRPTAPPEILKISHADQLLVIDDHHQLIKAGYWLLLGRAPDALGEGLAVQTRPATLDENHPGIEAVGHLKGAALLRLEGQLTRAQALQELAQQAGGTRIGIDH